MKVMLFLMLLFALQGIAPPACMAESKEDKIEKTYTYRLEEKDGKGKEVEDEIIKDGNSYTLKDIKYESTPVRITVDVETNDKDHFETRITKIIDGKEVTLLSKPDITWKEEGKEVHLSHAVEYGNRNEIPEKIEKDGYTFLRTDIEEKTKRETFESPALFISYSPDSDEYLFNGKRVHVEDTPVWQGYEKDIADYLGIEGREYTITGGKFISGFVLSGEEDGHYNRKAVFTGTRVVPYYLATFTYDGESQDEKKYKASVTYEAENLYDIKAVCTYEKAEEKPPLREKVVIYSLAFLVLSIMTAYAIYLLKRRKKEQE